VTERFHEEYIDNGKKESEDDRATEVWIRQNHRWMRVAAHSSRIAAN